MEEKTAMEEVLRWRSPAEKAEAEAAATAEEEKEGWAREATQMKMKMA